MRRLIGRGLEATASLWPNIRQVFARVHEAAAILDNPAGDSGETVRGRYEALLERLRAEATELPALAPAIAHFLKVTQSYWPGLFHCYDVPGLPRTNNDLEQFFGAVRYQERRACGRKVASPTLVLRGAVRVVAASRRRVPKPSRPSNWLRGTWTHGALYEPNWHSGIPPGCCVIASAATRKRTLGTWRDAFSS